MWQSDGSFTIISPLHDQDDNSAPRIATADAVLKDYSVTDLREIGMPLIVPGANDVASCPSQEGELRVVHFGVDWRTDRI